MRRDTQCREPIIEQERGSFPLISPILVGAFLNFFGVES